MEYVIGISFACRDVIAGVFDIYGNKIARAAVRAACCEGEDGQEEYDPEDWSEACFQAVREAVRLGGIDPENVRCVTAAGHNSELVMLGEGNVPVCRSVVGRGKKYPEEDEILSGLSELADWTGNAVLRENLASKILWYKKHQPEMFSKVRHILYGKDWLLFKLTGRLSCDVTTAGYSQLFDVKGRCWSDEMFRYLDLEKTLMPPVYESEEIIGTLTSEAAGKTGLPISVPCAAGLTNKACIELASHAVEEGDDIYTLNLSGNIITHSKNPYMGDERRIHTFCSAVRGEYMLLADTAAAFSALLWFERTFCPDLVSGDSKNMTEFEKLAARAPKGTGTVLFLPYIKGETVPVLDQKAKGVFLGVDERTTRCEAAGAVAEGICYSTLDCVSFMHETTGISQRNIYFRAMGDPDFWMQVIADAGNRPVNFIVPQDGSITGAAVLAAAAAGVYPDAREASKAMISEGSRYEPDRRREPGYRKNYGLYQRIYPAIKDIFHNASR